MTTPGAPDPFQPPQTGGYPPPAPGSYPPPGGYPPPAPGGYPPPAGPAYGAPPSGPAYGPPAGPPVDPNAFAGSPPPAVPPPAAPKPGKKKRLIIVGAVLVVVIGFITFAVIRNQKTAITAASVGTCIKVIDPSPTDPKTSQDDCADPAAVYIVTETGGSDVTCDPHEASYTETTKSNKTTATVCMRPNIKAGDCWDPGLTSADAPEKISCTTAKPSLSAQKLLALITTSSDDSNCPDGTDGTQPLVKRHMVYCYGPLS